MSKRLTARECLAVLEERINNLISRFDKFEERQDRIYERIDGRLNQHEALINDLSHKVRNLVEERAMSRKYKVAILSSLIGFICFILRDLLVVLLR